MARAVAEVIEAKPDLGQIPPIKDRDMGVPTPEPLRRDLAPPSVPHRTRHAGSAPAHCQRPEPTCERNNDRPTAASSAKPALAAAPQNREGLPTSSQPNALIPVPPSLGRDLRTVKPAH